MFAGCLGNRRWWRVAMGVPLLVAFGTGCGNDSAPTAGAIEGTDGGEPLVSAQPASPAPAIEQDPAELAAEARARNALAEHLGQSLEETQSARRISLRALEWSDSALGCDTPGAQVYEEPQAGYEIAFEVDGARLQVQVGAETALVCDEFQGLLAPRRRGFSVQQLNQQQQQAARELAAQLQIDVSDVTFGRSTGATWNDTDLGCPEYAPPRSQEGSTVSTFGAVSGTIFELRARGYRVSYRTDGERVFACPPLGADAEDS